MVGQNEDARVVILLRGPPHRSDDFPVGEFDGADFPFQVTLVPALIRRFHVHEQEIRLRQRGARRPPCPPNWYPGAR